MSSLRERLRCDDEAEFNSVARELSSIPRGEAIKLLEDLSLERDGTFRCRAIDKMVQLSAGNAERLARQFLSDKEWFVRITAIRALAKLDVVSAAPLIAHLLATDPEELVRSWAALALSRLGDVRVIPVLQAAADNDMGTDHEDVPIRYTALKAIEAIRSRLAKDETREK